MRYNIFSSREWTSIKGLKVMYAFDSCKYIKHFAFNRLKAVNLFNTKHAI